MVNVIPLGSVERKRGTTILPIPIGTVVVDWVDEEEGYMKVFLGTE